MKQKLNQLWLAETVRLNEQNMQKFDDSEANSQARLLKGRVEQRILLRAQWLGQTHGWLTLQQQCRQSAKVALYLLMALAILTGAGLGLTALAVNPVNLFWALISLLGLHVVTFIVWLFSFLLPLKADMPAVLGRIWLWLTARFAKEAKQASLMPAFFNVLAQKRAMRWLLGLVVNGLWSLILCSAIILMVLLLSVKHYSFLWQTTLFDSHAFLQLIEVMSFLPSQLGFPLPDPRIIIESGATPLDDANARQVWAMWLIGVVLIYGLLPRILSFLFCTIRWKIATSRLHLDMRHPEYQWLADTLAPSHDNLGIIDVEQASDLRQFQQAYLSHATGKALVAIELSEQWQPILSEHINNLGVIQDRQQRQQVLEQLQAQPVAQLLIVCDAKRSPDRGITTLIRTLMDKAQTSRLLLLNQSDYLPYWHEIRQNLQLEEGDLTWLESQDE